MPEFDVNAIRDRANDDGPFRLHARYWNAVVGLEVGDDHYELRVVDGRIDAFGEVAAGGGPYDIAVSADAEAWAMLLSATPPPGFQDIMFSRERFVVSGDLVGSVAPYYAALQAFVNVVREMVSGPTPSAPALAVERTFDSAVGRYVHVNVDGLRYRIYFEEAGDPAAIPMVLQHTAGADGRQWRHVLEDEDYQQRFHMFAYDLPFHGKSLPPTGAPWWGTEYRLTRSFLMDVVLAFARALELDRPVYMGCSIGGHLAPDLALYHPDDFRAVIGINGGLATGQARIDKTASWFHPRVSNDWKAASMLGVMSPLSPQAYRQETAFVYSQGAPAALKGDVHYYSREHDLSTEQARQIDTAKVGVYLLTGEYDALADPRTGTAELARNIPGSVFHLIPGMGHFGPAEHPAAFKEALLPVLDEVVDRYSG